MSGLSSSFEEYVDHLKKKFDQLSRTMLTLQRKQQEKQSADISNKLGKTPIYSVGQLVYLYKPSSSSLTANSKKIAAQWCGPLLIHEVLDRTHYILATMKGEILRDVFIYNRLKPCFMRASTERKNITHIQKLNEALGRSTNAQEQGNANTEKPSVHFIYENDEKLPEFDAEQIMCSQISDPIYDSDYLHALTNNNQ